MKISRQPIALRNRFVRLESDVKPMGVVAMVVLCGSDEEKWQEATVAAGAVLTARHRMWDGGAKELAQGNRGASGAPKSAIDLASRWGRGRSS